MKKNITINLCGTLYAIDEDAYQLLERYLNEMKNYFKNQEGGEEIADDIEHRVAELFWELKSQGVDAITIEHVREIIQKIGNPQDLDREEKTEEKTESPKTDFVEDEEVSGNILDRYLKSLKGRRIFRDTQDKILGGVCSGLTHFLGGTDPLPLRIIWVLLAIFVNSHVLPLFWIFVIAYLVCWVVLPEAKSPEDKLNMEGKKVTPENLQEQILKEETEKTRPVSSQNSASGCLGTLLKIIIGGFLLFWGCIFLIVLFALLVSSIAVGGALFGFGDMEGFGMGAGIVEFIHDNTWWLTTGLVSSIVVLFIPIYAIIRKLFSSNRMSGRQAATLAIIWFIALVLGGAAFGSMSASWKTNAEKYEQLGLDEDGPSVTQPFDFKDFNELSLSSDVEVYYTQADSFEVSLEGHGSIFDHYRVYKDGNKLCIEKKVGILDSDSNVKLYVSAPTLNKVFAQGACEFHSNVIEQDSLQLNFQGAARLDIDQAQVKYLTIESKGASEIDNLNAVCDIFHMEAKGASQGNLKVKSQKCLVRNSGASQIDLEVDCDELEVHNSGAGQIEITGTAKKKTIDNKGAGQVNTDDMNDNEENDSENEKDESEGMHIKVQM